MITGGMMGRFGMRSFAVPLIVLTLTSLVLFNQHITVFDSTSSSSSSSISMSAGSTSYDMTSLHGSNLLEGEEVKRRGLQAYSRSYVGYNVLRANYVCCPPQSGRSYYTRNCRSASGPVRPYRRSCSAMTRCARS